jgi:hypothetical protein
MRTEEEIREMLNNAFKSVEASLSDKKLPDGKTTMKEFTENTKFGRESLLCTNQIIKILKWVLNESEVQGG